MMEQLSVNAEFLELLALQPKGTDVISNLYFPKSNGDFKLIKLCGIDRALKEIKFWTEQDKEQWKCNGVELIFSNFKSVFLGKAKKGEPGRSVQVQKKVKRIEVEKHEVVKGKGSRRTVCYFDAADKQIAHHKYFTAAFSE
jgi:hypothetical protein